jgi:riboflavin kinase
MQHGNNLCPDPASPTSANLPEASLEPITSVAKTGIYFGFARVYEDHEGDEQKGSLAEDDLKTLPMVMSLGWNPFYKNEKLTAVRTQRR